MRRFGAHAQSLATTTGERPMACKTATSVQQDQRNRRLGPHQMDLFGANASEGMAGIPSWRDLPREAQDALSAAASAAIFGIRLIWALALILSDT